MFEIINSAPPDPILGLNEAFLKDPRQDKINLTSGVYRDEQGRTPILRTVKLAEEKLLRSETSKGYLGIDGLEEFDAAATKLCLGGDVSPDQVATVQTPGGTGALRVAADFLATHFRSARVWCSNPTWPNHIGVFQSAGLDTKTHPYLSADKTSLDLSGMLEALEREGRAGDAICLHACCHNPSGIDPTAEQWDEIAQLTAQRGMLPLIDFAYQGFGLGLEADRVAIQQISKHHSEFLVCSSYSKNFGLYSERVGAMLAVVGSKSVAERVLSQLKQAVRVNYSNPPRHGAAIVATILNDDQLRGAWLDELAEMRNRIHAMRTRFVEGMKETGCGVDFSFLMEQKGMFSFSGLNPMQVDWLRSQKGVYMVGSGRINVAGITSENLPPLCASVAEALKL